MKRVCLITPGQPSNNPRMVKEADALSEAGYAVHAICADCGLWPSLMDRDVMAHRSWTFEYAAGNARSWPGIARRARHRLAGTVLPYLPAKARQLSAISPVAPELVRAALRFPADIYIAHHLIALPAATAAARKFRAKAGYDIEDLYTNMRPATRSPGPLDRLMERTERRHIAQCDYVTAAAPGFSAFYESKYGICPAVTLNVFPLSERPKAFRATDAAAPLRLYWFSQCIGENRGLEDVVRALGLLRDERIELHLRGNWQAGYRDRLRGVAEAAGADWNCVTAHPPASPDEMARLAAEYDAGLAPEQPVDENKKLCLSNKLFVYLLAGNAVAASALPGQKRIADSLEEAAFSYEPGDVHGLAQGLRHWSGDRRVLDTARRRAWKWGTERYNWDLEKNTFLDVVNNIMGGSDAEESRPLASTLPGLRI